MWREGRCSAESPTFHFPERVVTPKPYQDPHPPCWMAATSDGSAEVAGENALGLLSFSIMQPLEKMASQIRAYRAAQKRAKPLTDVATNKVAAYTLVHCADSVEQASRTGIWDSVGWWYQNLAQFTLDWELAHLSQAEQDGNLPAHEAPARGQRTGPDLPRGRHSRGRRPGSMLREDVPLPPISDATSSSATCSSATTRTSPSCRRSS
ncbi:MAG: LLM class flavin-dependent oxidoreductase [Myxococcota bacterium]